MRILLLLLFSTFMASFTTPQHDGVAIKEEMKLASSAVNVRPTVGTLHLIAIYDNDAANAGALKDLENLKAEADKIASTVNLSLSPHEFEKNQLTETEINQFISSLSPGGNDVVWTVYMGHGSNSQTDQFSMFTISDDVGISLTEYHNDIKRRGARLTITFFSCCNHNAPMSIDSVRSLNPYRAICKQLFLYSKGDIRVASSSPNQYSYGDPDGSFFINAFFSILKELSFEEANWKSLLEQTTAKTELEASAVQRNQRPVFDCNISLSDGASRIEVGNTPDNTDLSKIKKRQPIYKN